ncbi:MAG: hypothetical protein JO300_12455 [Silvibacterium sp.]|nr:hypothetical protein [Silvibacterium sp.]MBV8437340.1 hypothetical protein [Silvibacterium sp.]
MPMDKTIRKYTSFDEMRPVEYCYWQSRPAYERLDAIEQDRLRTQGLEDRATSAKVTMARRPHSMPVA